MGETEGGNACVVYATARYPAIDQEATEVRPVIGARGEEHKGWAL